MVCMKRVRPSTVGDGFGGFFMAYQIFLLPGPMALAGGSKNA